MKAGLFLTLLICGYYIAFAQSSEWSLPSQGILFSQGSAVLSTPAKRRLATLAMRMQANPDFRIVIEGNSGNTEAGLKLSQRRINAVIRYLVEQQNMDWQRFMCKPKGSALDNQVFYRQPYDGEEGPSCWYQIKRSK